MGQWSNCCCEIEPFDGFRKIWTERPWGAFFRPFDMDAFEATLTESGGNITSDFVGYPLAETWPQTLPKTPIWVGTRYIARVTHYKYTGLSTVTSEYEEWEWWVIDVVDPNTGNILSRTNGTVLAGPAPYRGDTSTYLDEQTETSWSRTETGEFGVAVQGAEVSIPVTYADQVARAKAHLDWNLAGMTDAQLRGTMILPKDGGSQRWEYTPGVTSLSAPYLRLIPRNGVLAASSEDEVDYTEWDPAGDQMIDTGSDLTGFGPDTVYGMAKTAFDGSTETTALVYHPGVLGDRDGDYTHAVPFDFYSGTGVDTVAVVSYSCLAVATGYGCASNGAQSRYQAIIHSSASPESRPTWGLTDTCFSPEHYAAPGWYYLTEVGIAKQITAGPTSMPAPPDADYMMINRGLEECCAP